MCAYLKPMKDTHSHRQEEIDVEYFLVFYQLVLSLRSFFFCFVYLTTAICLGAKRSIQMQKKNEIIIRFVDSREISRMYERNEQNRMNRAEYIYGLSGKASERNK